MFDDYCIWVNCFVFMVCIMVVIGIGVLIFVFFVMVLMVIFVMCGVFFGNWYIVEVLYFVGVEVFFVVNEF